MTRALPRGGDWLCVAWCPLVFPGGTYWWCHSHQRLLKASSSAYPHARGHAVRMCTSFYLCGPLCLDTVIEEAKAGCRATYIPHVLLPGDLGQLSPNHNSAHQDPGGGEETQVKLGTPARAVRGESHHTATTTQVPSRGLRQGVQLAEGMNGETVLDSWVMQEVRTRGSELV